MIAALLLALALDPVLTPGRLCSQADPDFDHVSVGGFAVCKRHVTPTVRRTVFARYGIPRGRWRDYELDHLVPLCAGGSNAVENLWPEPLAHAAKKDRLEAKVCSLLRARRVEQEAALVMLSGK